MYGDRPDTDAVVRVRVRIVGWRYYSLIGCQRATACCRTHASILTSCFSCQPDITSCGAEAQQTPALWPVLSIAASRGFSELTKNVIRSSHGHSAPSLKISCKSVQPFSRNLANKKTKKERNIHTYKEIDRKQYPVPRCIRDGVIKICLHRPTEIQRHAHIFRGSIANSFPKFGIYFF